MPKQSPEAKIEGLKKKVKKYIKENNHLPDLQSAIEMKENGMNVSEMQTKLLQKIEEMTLYMIEKDKQLAKQEKKFQKLEDELRELKPFIKTNHEKL